jgi:hypothetical protein
VEIAADPDSQKAAYYLEESADEAGE